MAGEDKLISELPNAELPLVGPELVVVVQDGVTVQATAEDIADLASGGGGSVTPPSLVFIAESEGFGIVGYDQDAPLGTRVYVRSAVTEALGSNIRLITGAPSGYLQLTVDGELAQDVFTSLAVDLWGATFLTASANFSAGGGQTTWIWSTDSALFVENGQYQITFAGFSD